MTFLERLGLSFPLIQAPMAGTSSPAMTAAASQAGALGSLGVGSTDAAGAQAMIAAARELGPTGSTSISSVIARPRLTPWWSGSGSTGSIRISKRSAQRHRRR